MGSKAKLYIQRNYKNFNDRNVILIWRHELLEVSKKLLNSIWSRIKSFNNKIATSNGEVPLGTACKNATCKTVSKL
jgi:galactose-1-phosphate uridylyltransferase